MRIDNHMAGYRPPPPKSKKRGLAKSDLPSASFLAGRANDSPFLQDDGTKKEDMSRDSARQRVHMRNKLEQAAYALATGGSI